MLGVSMDRELLENLIGIYRPEYIWKPADMAEAEDSISTTRKYN